MWQKVLVQIGVAAAEALIPGIGQGAKKKEMAILAAQAAAREFAKAGLIPSGIGDKDELGQRSDEVVSEYDRKGWPVLDPDNTRVTLTPNQLVEMLKAARGT